MTTRASHPLVLAAPAVLFLAVFMLIPLGLMLYVSTLERAPFGGVQWGQHTGIAYEKLLFERDLAGKSPSTVIISQFLRVLSVLRA